MEEIDFKTDISSMLEVEVGFKGKFILEQQCQRVGIEINEIKLEHLDELAANIHQSLANFVGPIKADMAYNGLLEYNQAVKKISKNKSSPISLANSYVILGDKRYYIMEFDGAMRSYGRAQELLNESKKKDLRLECKIKRKMARILAHTPVLYDDARKEYEKTIELGNLICDRYDVALGYLGLGKIAWQEGNYTGALENFSYATDNIEKLPSSTRNEKVIRNRVVGLIQVALADLHLDLNDVERAVNHNEAAIDIFLDLENYLGVNKLYKKLGLIYKQRKEYDSMLTDQRKAAFINDENGPVLMEGWTRMNLASLLMEDGKFSLAEEHLSKAYDILSEFNYPEAQAKLHYMYGSFYYKKRDMDASEDHFLRSLDYVRGQDLPEYFARAQEGLGTLYMYKGDREKGTSLLQSALTWHENNNNVEGIKRISGLLQIGEDYRPIGIALMNQP